MDSIVRALVFFTELLILMHCVQYFGNMRPCALNEPSPERPCYNWLSVIFKNGSRAVSFAVEFIKQNRL